MYYPSFEASQQLRDRETSQQVVGPSVVDSSRPTRPLLPLYCDILADMETPVSAYCKTAQSPYSFLLESVSGGVNIARYSFIGIDPYLVMVQRGETMQLLHMPAHQHALSSSPIRIEERPCHDPLS